MSTDFENKCKDISCTELWKIFKEKCSEEEFVVAVGKVCEFGIEKSETIMTFFPNFTLHNITHIRNVCNWMTALLGDRANELKAQGAAMLLMSACCHDIGMSVSAEQEKKLKEKLDSKAEQREYVRLHHHERVGEHLTTKVWGEKLDTDKALQRNGIRRNDLLNLCKSHGEDLAKLVVPANSKYDPRLCAVLLRLADILDFDSSRAPQSLFEHMGLNAPEDFEQEISQLEWIKNSSGSFEIIDRELVYTADYSDPNIEHKVNEYLKWVKHEIEACREYISKFVGDWNNLRLPYRIKTKIYRIGYEGGDFQITMDQERIINLLAGENLYSDPCVFVRELLQNSIDAILWRGENDSSFNAKEHGKITITTWHDGNGQGWFKIEDNGTGMDENVIKNYFLRAGRSYYTSDDFAKERDIYSPDKTYKPISRFGIGILSCFMSDKNNKLEVSTKRYSHDRAKENPGLRLSVTGLKGYYTLAKENEQEECDWQKMPAQNKEEEYFRTEPGTTICVGMNLFSLGDYRNIKEVVDKYVQFPDMKVEYRGIEGPDKYPTKDEFMKAIAELKEEHGDTCPIVRRYPIPDKEFERLKKYYPELKWKSVPELVFNYYPLDNYSSGDDLCGLAVVVVVDKKSIRGSFSIGDNTYPIELRARPSFKDNGSVNVNFSVYTPDKPDNKIKELERSDDEEAQKAIEAYDRLYSRISIAFSLSDLSGLLSVSEKKLLEYAFRGKIDYSTISYNGVFAGDGQTDYYFGDRCIVIFLRGSYAPEVNVARDSITKLPIEAAVEFGIIDKSVGNSYLDEKSYASGFYYESEKKLSELIIKHPEWESRIVIEDYDGKEKAVSEITKGDSLRFLSFDKRSLYHNIAIAFLKEKYSLSYSVEHHRFFIEDKEDNRLDTSDFPVQMFFKFRDNSKLLGVISNYISNHGLNVYSPEHRFSRWLIKNRKSLEKELPIVYKKILDIMIMSLQKTAVIKNLNEQLTQLKNYKNNHFGITDELYLTEDDFA